MIVERTRPTSSIITPPTELPHYNFVSLFLISCCCSQLILTLLTSKTELPPNIVEREYADLIKLRINYLQRQHTHIRAFLHSPNLQEPSEQIIIDYRPNVLCFDSLLCPVYLITLVPCYFPYLP